MTENLHAQAEQALGYVSEGTCPLCKVQLRIHDDRACCPCCGDSYKAATDRLEIRRCAEHGRDCEHWDMVWRAKLPQ
jgi:hypothetical protein